MNYTLRKAARTEQEFGAAVKRLNEEFNSYSSAAEIASDPKFVYTAAELIRQLVEDRFRAEDPTDLLMRRIPGPALGDWLELEETINTAKVVQRSLGGKPKVVTPRKNKYPVNMDDWRVDFGFELEAVATGQLDVGVWIDHAAEAVSRYHVTGVLGAIDAACQVGTLDAYGRPVRTVTSTAVDSTSMDTALKRLGDVNPGVVIAGRYSALYPIFAMGTDDVSTEEFRTRGAIGRYRGATLVVLRDGYNPFYGSANVPDDRIYLAGSDKGGVMAETDMSRFNYQVVDQEEQHFRVGIKGRNSFTVIRPWQYHVIEIT